MSLGDDRIRRLAEFGATLEKSYIIRKFKSWLIKNIKVKMMNFIKLRKKQSGFKGQDLKAHEEVLPLLLVKKIIIFSSFYVESYNFERSQSLLYFICRSSGWFN